MEVAEPAPESPGAHRGTPKGDGPLTRNASSETLLLRADGGPGHGAGHVMRCLALAHGWQDGGGTAVLVTHQAPAWLARRLADDGVARVEASERSGSPADAAFTAREARARGAEWVVADGYHLGEPFQRGVRAAGARLLVLDDDAHLPRYDADLLLNQNLHAVDGLYEVCAAHVPRLLGPRFALLRSEFWPDLAAGRQHPALARRLLVSLGRAAPPAVVARVVDALAPLRVPDMEVVLVGGERDAWLDERLAGTAGPWRVEPDVRDMPALLSGIDLALSAAGSTSWELARLGVPSLVFSLAENQRAVARSLEEAGAALDLGWNERLDPARLREAVASLAGDAARRRALGERAAELVDGEGGRRVAMHLGGRPLRLREARPADDRLLWTWANDPAVRASAFTSDTIAWREHRAWFAGKLADPRCRVYLALDAADEPVGQIRFDRGPDDREAEIDVCVAPHRRGGGIGSALIALGTARAFRTTPIERVRARIKPDNAGSIRAFGKAGFARDAQTTVGGQPAVDFLLERAS